MSRRDHWSTDPWQPYTSGQAPIEPLPLPPVAEKSDLSDDEWEKDEVFLRLFRMTETMIEQGQAALNFEFKALGRVLSQYNQDEDEDDETEEDKKKEGMCSLDLHCLYLLTFFCCLDAMGTASKVES